MSNYLIEYYKKCISDNAAVFLEKMDISQNELSKRLDCSAATISKIKNKKAPPNLALLLYLFDKYHISLDEFVTQRMDLFDMVVEEPKEDGEVKGYEELKKYLGIYQVYYFYNGYIENEQAGNIDRSLNYGVLQIFNGKDAKKNTLSLRAVMGLKDKRDAEHIKRELSGQIREKQDEFFDNLQIKHAYLGTFFIAPNHIVINMECEEADHARILLPRPKVMQRQDYSGGLGTLNSISKVEYSPCIQYVALSRADLDRVSPEEIAEYLYMKDSKKMVYDLRELENFIKRIFREEELQLSKEEKNMLVNKRIEGFVEKQIKSEFLRVSRVMNRDNEWYQMIKPYIKKGGRAGDEK